MKCPDCQNGWYLGAGLKPPERCTTCKGTGAVPEIPTPDVEKLRALHKGANLGYPTGLKKPETKGACLSCGYEFRSPAPRSCRSPERHAKSTPYRIPAPDDDLVHKIDLLTDLLKDIEGKIPRPPGVALPIQPPDGPTVTKGTLCRALVEPVTAPYFRPTGVRMFAVPGQYEIKDINICGYYQIPAPVDASFFACLMGAIPIKWGWFSNYACCYPLQIEYEVLAGNAPPLRGYVVGEEHQVPPAGQPLGHPQP